MAYKHILIAVDLSPESKVLVEKAVSMARPYNAKVSLIHVDVNYSDLYTGLIDVNLGDMQKHQEFLCSRVFINAFFQA